MNCKAVVVRGTKGIRLAETAAFLEVALSAHEALRASSYHKQVHGPETPDLPRLWRRRRAGCACCPVSCRDSYAVPGHGGAVLPREARTGLWPELRRRDAGLWFELARQCEQDGVDALSALTTVRRLAARGELDLPAARAAAGAPADAGGREAVRRILRVVTERAPGADAAERCAWPAAEPPAASPADWGAGVAGAGESVAAAVAALVGACERLAGAEGDPLGPDGFAAALSAGLGRAVGADDLARAAERVRRLEGVLARNVRAARPAPTARPAPRSPGRLSGDGQEAPLDH